MKTASGVSRKKRILLVAGSAVFLLVLVLFLLLFVREKQKDSSFDALYRETRELLGQGINTGMPNRFSRLEKAAADSLQYLKAMDLALVYAERTGDYDSLLSLSRRALERYPGRQDLAALRVYALLRSGDIVQASETASRLTDSQWDGLRAEVLLAGLIENDAGTGEASLSSGPEENPYTLAAQSRNAETLLAAAELTGIREFFLDAALLFLGRGENHKAYEIAFSRLREVSPEFFLLASLDAGEDMSALAGLNQLEGRGEAGPLMRLIRGDIFLRRGAFREARDFYAGFCRDYPGEIWLSWYNWYWAEKLLFLDQTEAGLTSAQRRRAMAVLQDGRQFFPDAEELSLALARDLVILGDLDEAELLLSSMIESNQGGLESELALLKILSGRRSPAYLEGRYWELVNRYPGWDDPALDFALYLLSWGEGEELERLLRQYERAGGSGDWLWTCRGMAQALARQWEEAEDSLTKAMEIRENTTACYNLALVKTARGSYRQAQELFRRAETLLGPAEEKTRKLRGKIRVELGIAFLLENDLPAAKREILYGLELNPENLRGQFYLKQIHTL